MGISGESISDIKRYSSKTDTLEIMEDLLMLNHLSPTSPDTVNTYPFIDNDPLIIEESPNVFFVGNQSSFDQKIVKNDKNEEILLLSIPKFVESSTIVLMNIQNLKTHTINFDF
jgi:DNA polymerase delta subunit 2